jgi:hypothetical protein
MAVDGTTPTFIAASPTRAHELDQAQADSSYHRPMFDAIGGHGEGCP